MDLIERSLLRLLREGGEGEGRSLAKGTELSERLREELKDGMGCIEGMPTAKEGSGSNQEHVERGGLGRI